MLFRRRYLDRLEQDLDRWIADGLVASVRREEILADAAAHAAPHTRARMAAMLTLLGVLLVGAGAIAFVAANWAEMARTDRLAVLLGSMVAAFAAGGWLLGRGGRPQAGQGMILLGVLLFGADIHLIAQTYQIQAHYPNGVLLWAAGALLAAAVVPAQPALWLAFALVGFWSGQEMFFDGGLHLHLSFLLLWALAAAVAVGFKWWRCLGFGIVVFAGWYALTGLALGGASVTSAAVMLVLPLVLWLVGERVPKVGDLLHGLGLVGVLLCAAVITEPMAGHGQLVPALIAGAVAVVAAGAAWAWARPSRLRLALALAVALLAPLRLAVAEGLPGETGDWLLIVAFLGVVIALAVLGGREGSPVTRRIAYTAFGLHIVMLYMGGTMSLLSLFVFFTVVGAGLLVSALRLEKRS